MDDRMDTLPPTPPGNVAIARHSSGNIAMKFAQPTVMFAMTPHQAKEIAQALIEQADKCLAEAH